MVCADFSVRSASCEDAGAIAVIQVEASQAAYGAFAPPGYFYGFTVPRRIAAWRTMIAGRLDTEQIIVADESRQIRGYANFGPSRDPGAPPNTGELYSLYVAPRTGDAGSVGDCSLKVYATLPGWLSMTSQCGCWLPIDPRARSMSGSAGAPTVARRRAIRQ